MIKKSNIILTVLMILLIIVLAVDVRGHIVPEPDETWTTYVCDGDKWVQQSLPAEDSNEPVYIKLSDGRSFALGGRGGAASGSVNWVDNRDETTGIDSSEDLRYVSWDHYTPYTRGNDGSYSEGKVHWAFHEGWIDRPTYDNCVKK